jgi:MFS family permease
MREKNSQIQIPSQNDIEKSFAKLITPIIVSVFAVYLTIGMTLGVLPSYIKNELQFGNLVVGAIIGLQSIATLLTRAYSGKITDTLGAKTANHRGLKLSIISGIIYMAAAYFSQNTLFALGLIFFARIIHGTAESFSVTGALTWGIGLVGAAKSGKVMTWNGIAMYAGIALGAPAAIWLKSTYGIQYVFLTIILLSIISWLSTIKLPSLPVDLSHIRTPFYKVIKLIADQGMGLAFSSIGFACISSFIALLFTERNWGNPSMAFMAFGTSYVLTRVFFSSFPDKFGGYRVAIYSLIIEIAGQVIIGFSSSAAMAIIGCSLTGIGFSLIFPALGVLAIKKVSPQMRGTALGAYAAFFDLSLGIAGPIAGIIAAWSGYSSVYLFGGISCLAAILILKVNKNK